jgi:hypothetical protein
MNVQRGDETFPQSILVGGLAFPDDDNAPAQSLKALGINCISCHIPQEFFPPEGRPRFWHGGVLAPFVAVPEAAVDKDHGVPSWQDDVRLTGQVLTGQCEAESVAVQQGSDASFRAGVVAPDATHVPTPAVWCQSIHRDWLEFMKVGAWPRNLDRLTATFAS